MAIILHEYSFHDKSKWGPGPWQDEPDKIQWIDETTGLDCLAVRPSHGSWCGYAAVKEGHLLYGKSYSEYDGENFITIDPEVHGGLTFSGGCDEDNTHGICHIETDGKKAWWFGFDTAHYRDYSPGRASLYNFEILDEEYRDLNYVIKETEGLALFLKNYAVSVNGN